MFPALLMAGPPHRGKSVLSYRLSRALEAERRAVYLFKATPDGEGQWYLESDQEEVARQRNKRPWDAAFTRIIGEIVEQRPLPYIVDAGGRPTVQQEQAILAKCTHAITVTKDEQERQEWRERCVRLGVPVIAEVQSSLEDDPAILSHGDPTRLRLVRMERQQHDHILDNAAGAHLIQRVRAIFALTEGQAWQAHRLRCPEPFHPLDLDGWLWARRQSTRWQRGDLPDLLAALPRERPLALYGGRPLWVAGAIAAVGDFPLCLFDAQVGWLPIPQLAPASEEASPWVVEQSQRDGVACFKFILKTAWLMPVPQLAGELPTAPADGLILEGKLPRWLAAALARHYRPQVGRLWMYDTRPHGAVPIMPVGRPLLS